MPDSTISAGFTILTFHHHIPSTQTAFLLSLFCSMPSPNSLMHHKLFFVNIFFLLSFSFQRCIYTTTNSSIVLMINFCNLSIQIIIHFAKYDENKNLIFKCIIVNTASLSRTYWCEWKVNVIVAATQGGRFGVTPLKCICWPQQK